MSERRVGRDGLADLPDEGLQEKQIETRITPTGGTTGAESWERMFISLLSRRDLERAIILG